MPGLISIFNGEGPIFVGDKTIQGALTVTGNLTVQGTTTTVVNETVTGTLTINPGTTPTDALVLDIASLGANGTRDSHNVRWTGKSYDGSSHQVDWKAFVDVTSNAGASTWTIQSRIDAGAFQSRLTLTDSGLLAVGTGTTAAPAFSFISDLGVGLFSGTNVLSLVGGTVRLYDSVSDSLAVSMSLGSGPARLVSFELPTMNATSGTQRGFEFEGTFSPASGTPIEVLFGILPTINWGGAPGAGSYEALRVAVAETSLPTGTNYLLRLLAGAGGATEKYAVRNTGQSDITLGTITTDVKALNITATWNAAGVTFASIFMNITDTLSAAGSLVAQLQRSGSDIFTISKFGRISGAMGQSTTLAAMVGMANVNATAVGNVGAGEDDLITYSLPANSLDANGKGVRIKAWGTTANNANAKTVKLYFGTAVILTNALTVSVAGRWVIEAYVIRTAASAQDVSAELRETGVGTSDIEIGTTTQVETGALTIKCTGEAVADNDIVQEGVTVEFLN